MMTDNSPTSRTNGRRIVALDYIRVLACFMVIFVHSNEFYYLGDGAVSFKQPGDRFWVSLYDSLLRMSVPLFVMVSSYLLLPITTDNTTFVRRRFTRIFFPFLTWSVAYAILPVLFGWVDGSIAERIVRIFYTFNDDAGHLWYMYMFVGIYLIAPILSPWLRVTSRRCEEAFLALWFISCLWGYLAPAFGEPWGKALWNEQHTLYYFSGFIGYVVLAHYIRTYLRLSLQRALAIGLPMIAIGYAITAGLFYVHTGVSDDYLYAEQSWNFCTFNVAMMTFGFFIIMLHCDRVPRWLYRPLVNVSKLSYGIYLMHIFFLNIVYGWLSPHMPTWAAIPSIAVLTMLICVVVSKLISLLPGSKYILG